MGLPLRQNESDYQIREPHASPDRDQRATDSAEALSDRIYGLLSKSLTGPTGLHSQTFVAAIGALAGYGARWLTRRSIAAELDATPFMTPKGCNLPYVSSSRTAETLVTSLNDASFASALVSRLMTSGNGWMPTVDTGLAHNFRGVNEPDFPDYTVAPQYWPQCSAASILIMLWERTRRELAGAEFTDHAIMQAFGLSAARAAVDGADAVPPAVAAQLALETAIATSRLEYAF